MRIIYRCVLVLNRNRRLHMIPASLMCGGAESHTATAVRPVFAPSGLLAVPAASNPDADDAAAGGCVEIRDLQSLRA